MDRGTKNEIVVMNWLRDQGNKLIDFRQFRLAQRIDVDCGIESIDGDIVLAEIKSDQHIREKGNLCFEVHRLNHFAYGNWFYLGWGYRSPAQKLIVRNPKTNKVYVFLFMDLRAKIGRYVYQVGKDLETKILVYPTDKQKTTVNWLIPMEFLIDEFSMFQL